MVGSAGQGIFKLLPSRMAINTLSKLNFSGMVPCTGVNPNKILQRKFK